jgi:hypothetical protein
MPFPNRLANDKVAATVAVHAQQSVLTPLSQKRTLTIKLTGER